MEILLRGIKEKNAEKLVADLEKAFSDKPEIVIEEGSEAGGTVQATVVYPAGDTRDRQSVANIIDTVIMRNDYVFCSVNHRDEPKDVTAVDEHIGGWPSL